MRDFPLLGGVMRTWRGWGADDSKPVEEFVRWKPGHLLPNQYGQSWEWAMWMGWVGDMNGVTNMDGGRSGRYGCGVGDI